MPSAAESDPRLVGFLADLTPLGTQRETWPSGAVLDISAYLTDRMPPMAFVSGVRAVLRNRDAILAFDEPEGTHILPGGRMEDGESPSAALIRELREECGCSVSGAPKLIGFLHLHHITPREAEYARYPYPDFLQLIYLVETTDDPVEGPGEPWVQRPRFVPIAEVDRLSLSAAERALLRDL